MKTRDETRDPRDPPEVGALWILRALTPASLVTAIGLLGALPAGSAAPSDPLALCLWLAVWAAPGGVACASVAPRGHARVALLVPSVVVPPLVWGMALWLLDRGAVRGVPDPLLASLAVTGLFGCGAALGSLLDARRALPATAAALLVVAVLAWFPGRGGLPGSPWPVALARVSLELSPLTFVAESAGVDWMRRAAVYDPVGTDRFQRFPYNGKIAVGWGLGGAVTLFLLANLSVGHASRSRNGSRST